MLLRRDDGCRVPLGPKTFDLLVYLLDRPGRVVDKRELSRAVWPRTEVGENSLNQGISALRRALGERPGQHRFIVTDSGRGYRFVEVVTRLVEPPEARSLAILPFTALDDDRVQHPLQLAMVEALLTRLASLHGIALSPLSSVRVVAERVAEPRAAARELGATDVLCGALSVGDGRIRADVRLLGVEPARELWAERYDEPIAAVFEIQDRIAESTVAAMGGSLTRIERRRLHRQPTRDPDAYQFYVSGWSRLTRPSSATLPEAIADLERAVALDPEFALAHACLADAYAVLAVFGGGAPHEIFPRANAAVSRALHLDPELAEAHAELGHIRMVYDLDMAGAEDAFERALRIDPSSTMAHHYMGLLAIVRGELDEALASIRAAQRLEPLALNFNANVGMVHYYARRYDAAARTLETTLAMNPSFDHARSLLGRTYLRLGRHDDALAHFARRSGTTVGSAADVAMAHAHAGRAHVARNELARLQARSRVAYVSAFDLASIHAALGDRDEALRCLAVALEQRAQPLMFVGVDPTFDALRGDPEFEHVRRRATGSGVDAQHLDSRASGERIR